MGIYIGIEVLAIFIGSFAVGIFLGSKRKKALIQLAPTIYFSYTVGFTDEDDDLLKSLSHLDLFRQTRSQGAWSVMNRAEEGLSVTIMQHRFSSGGGKGRKVSEQTVIVFQSDLLRLPSFTLRRQNLGHDISTAILGYRDFNFDTRPTFSKQFHLHGSNELGWMIQKKVKYVHFTAPRIENAASDVTER